MSFRKNLCLSPGFMKNSLMFSSGSFTVLVFTFRSRIYVELIFVRGLRWSPGSPFFLYIIKLFWYHLWIKLFSSNEWPLVPLSKAVYLIYVSLFVGFILFYWSMCLYDIQTSIPSYFDFCIFLV